MSSPGFSTVSPVERTSLSGKERWLLKKQKAEKRRRCGGGKEETKQEQNKLRPHRPAARKVKVDQRLDTLDQSKQGLDPPPTPANQRRGGGGQGGTFIKTSSLFRHNPDIPELNSPVISQIKEKVFTSDLFSETDLHPHLVATLDKVLGVTTMTSVQKQTIPVLLSGRDAVVRSQTGSGKTLSYGVPLVQALQNVQPRISRADGPLALILVPTRELAQQSFHIFQKLVKPFTWIVPGVLMGGEKRKAEKARLRKGINILVCTPGRLVDHIHHTLNMVLTSVRWLVLDEADRILDLGFEKDLTVILNTLNSTGAERHNVLLSATLTQGLARLADVCLKDPVSIQLSDSAPCDIISPAGQSESFAVPDALQQNVVLVPSKLRLVCLAAFILDKCKFSQGNKIIVFMSSCEAVEFLLSLFTSVLCRPTANHTSPLHFLRLHGNMKQEERTEVFQEFSVSKSGILLCTDVAARGLDLPQVTWIVQYTPPISAAEYVHRVGRTARIGAGGSSLLFLTPAESSYLGHLAQHQISLSEIKLHDILSTLMQDDAYKGRGKYHSQTSSSSLHQEVRERATVLQTEFENVVHKDTHTLQTAKRALQSFLRSYTTYPAPLKSILHLRSLHLGHAAKSFGLREAPAALGAATRGRKLAARSSRGRQADRGEVKRRCTADLLTSEFSSGLEGVVSKQQKKAALPRFL